MRLLAVIGKRGGGGAERSLDLLAAQARSAEWRVEMLYLRQEGSTKSSVLSDLARIRAAIIREKPDAVLSFLTYFNLVTIVAALTVRGRPRIVISERNVPTALLRREGIKGRIKLRSLRLLYRFADRVICLSQACLVDLAVTTKLHAKALFLVPNPIPAALWNTPPPGQSRSHEFRSIAYVGRLVEWKRVDLLLHAAALLEFEGKDIRLEIVGDGPEASALKLLAQKLGLRDVNFRGWEPQPNLNGLDCIVLPSDVEGFGNVLVEATAQWIPVVCFRHSLGAPDAIIHDETGIVVESDGFRKLARAVDRACEMSVNASARMILRDRHSEENAFASLRDAIEDL